MNPVRIQINKRLFSFGFTIIEILVVLLIVGLLMSSLVSSVNKTTFEKDPAFIEAENLSAAVSEAFKHSYISSKNTLIVFFDDSYFFLFLDKEVKSSQISENDNEVQYYIPDFKNIQHGLDLNPNVPVFSKLQKHKMPNNISFNFLESKNSDSNDTDQTEQNPARILFNSIDSVAKKILEVSGVSKIEPEKLHLVLVDIFGESLPFSLSFTNLDKGTKFFFLCNSIGIHKTLNEEEYNEFIKKKKQ